MSVLLHVFPQVTILSVARPVGERQIKVLAAGVARLFENGAKNIIVDGRGAKLDEPAITSLLQVKPTFVGAEKDRVILFVGFDTRICDHAELNEALAAMKVESVQMIDEIIQADSQLGQLRVNKVKLEETLGGSGDAVMQKFRKTQGDRARLEKLKSGMSTMLSRMRKNVDRWGKTPQDPEMDSRLTKALSEIRSMREGLGPKK